MSNFPPFKPKESLFEKVSKVNTLTRIKVNILWTGGFDSTFRMVQLSRLEADIQPFYIMDQRSSREQELNAIACITADIMKHPETKCTILPIIKINVSDLEVDKSITEAYLRLKSLTNLGSQFDWLGRFAKTIPGLEFSMEKGETSKGYNCIKNYGKLIRIDKKGYSYYILDKENSNADLLKIFGTLRFPVSLFHTTKLEMVDLYKKLGFEDTMNKTWFCHHPVKNEPCGTCNPCKSAIKEGLAFRLPPKAIKRYNNCMKYGSNKWYRYLLKCQLILVNAL